jgi:RNA polymerase sigma factor (sigma-70 family)
MNAEARYPAVAEFFQEEHGRLVGYVRRWLDEAADEEAEDIVQDVAVNIFNRGDITAPIRNLSAYVYRALKNRIVDYLRQKKLSLSLDEPQTDNDARAPTLADLLKDDSTAPQSELEKKEVHALLYQAIDSLKPEDRAIIIATDFEGRTFQDVAEDWDMPLGTLLARKARALKKIKNILTLRIIS